MDRTTAGRDGLDGSVKRSSASAGPIGDVTLRTPANRDDITSKSALSMSRPATNSSTRTAWMLGPWGRANAMPATGIPDAET